MQTPYRHNQFMEIADSLHRLIKVDGLHTPVAVAPILLIA
jgi:hypothetical protein